MGNPISKFQSLKSQYGYRTAFSLLANKLIGNIQKVLPQTPGPAFFSPWNISFEERVALLQESSKKKIVFFYPSHDQGTFRYRIYNMCQVINLHLNEYVASYFYAAEIEDFLSSVEKFDLLIISRFDWTPTLQKLVDKARSLNIKVVYDTDDLVFDPEYTDAVIKHLSINAADAPIWKDTIQRNYQAAQLADSFLCTNNFLAERISNKFNKPVSIIPNFLNQEQVEFASSFQKPESDKFWLGYFSGTKSHDKDFELLESSLVNVLDANPDINLRLMGHVKTPASLKKYQSRIEQFAFQDFINYLGVIGSCDVVLVPLVVNDFTNCKSELKFFESGLMQVPIIASPTYIYQLVINEGENGVIAGEGEWETKITELYRNRNLLNEMSRAAHHTSLKDYYGQVIIDKVRNFLNQLV